MIGILGKLFLRGVGLEISTLNRMLKLEFTKIRHEFDEHLQSINENTNEISSNFEYICELENKLDRLSSRVDNLQMYIEASSGVPSERKKEFNVKRLDRKEQEVFLVIYTLEEEKGAVTYGDIAQRLGISEHLAASYVTSLIEKGVPVIKRYINLKPHLRLDKEFKTLQTKENILQFSLQEFGF